MLGPARNRGQRIAAPTLSSSDSPNERLSVNQLEDTAERSRDSRFREWLICHVCNAQKDQEIRNDCSPIESSVAQCARLAERTTDGDRPIVRILRVVRRQVEPVEVASVGCVSSDQYVTTSA